MTIDSHDVGGQGSVTRLAGDGDACAALGAVRVGEGVEGADHVSSIINSCGHDSGGAGGKDGEDREVHGSGL